MLPRARLRVHAVALATISWAVFVWTQAVSGPFDRFGQLRGMDFVQFYVAGHLVAEGRAAELYDWDAFAALLPAIVPGIGTTLYLPVYPPQVALAFAPLGRLEYSSALAVWTAVSIAFYVAATFALLRKLPSLVALKPEVWAFALGFPPFVQLLAHGHVSAVALAIVVIAQAAFRRSRHWWVGFALGSLIFKPQLGTFVGVALVMCPSRALLGGALIAALAQIGITMLALGPDVVSGYLDVVGRILERPDAFEPKPWAMHSLRGTFELLLGSGPAATSLWLSASVCALVLARRAVHVAEDRDVQFAVIVLTALLVNPHLYIYDLVLLVVPLAGLAAWLLAASRPDPVGVRLVYSLIWLPLLAPVAALTRVQLTAPVMLALVGSLAYGWTRTTHAPSR